MWILNEAQLIAAPYITCNFPVSCAGYDKYGSYKDGYGKDSYDKYGYDKYGYDKYGESPTFR
jgi:hypothetical protein